MDVKDYSNESSLETCWSYNKNKCINNRETVSGQLHRDILCISVSGVPQLPRFDRFRDDFHKLDYARIDT